MARRQIPRHKRHAQAKKPEGKPATTPPSPPTAATPPSPPTAATPRPDPEALRASVRLLAAQVREDERRAQQRLFRGWSALQFLIGESFEDSLLRMLRARIIASGVPRCEQRDIIQIRQHRLGDPLDPVAQPRSHLMCPLHEARQDGRLSPCANHYDPDSKDEGITSILRAGRRAVGHAVSRASLRFMFDLLEYNDLTPCDALATDWSLREIICGPRGRFKEADPRELLDRREQLLSVDQANLSGDELRALIRFLHDSGRLTIDELDEIVSGGLYATDRGWISCRDDEERTSFAGAGKKGHDFRIRCPLQHRALLGDRTVPCALALEHEQDAALIAEAKEAAPPRHRPTGEPPRSWSTPEQEPGQEGDIVRRLRLLPCHVVGRLLALELPAMMARLRDEVEPTRKETSGNATDWAM